jgi:outer membrane lipoprotein LolB
MQRVMFPLKREAFSAVIRSRFPSFRRRSPKSLQTSPAASNPASDTPSHVSGSILPGAAVVLLVAAQLVLASCATHPGGPAKGMSWQQRMQNYSRLTDWQLKGRLGLRSGATSGTATLIWNEASDSRHLRLLGPAGQGLALLEESAAGAVLTDRSKTTWQGPSAQDLIEHTTGWKIPVASLRWWALGIVEPGSNTDYRLDEQQRLASLSQDGWQVSFGQYRSFGTYELPGSIVFHYVTGDEPPTLRGKFLLKDWKPAAD